MKKSPWFVSLCLLVVTLPAATPANPPWAGQRDDGGEVRVAVSPPAGERFPHLAWPKAVRAPDGTIVLGYQIGTHHGDNSCPAVSLSTDDGKTFSAPHVLKEFNPGMEYTNSGNMALGIAHDGAVILLSHGHRGKEANYIFGWRSADSGRTWTPVNTSALGPNKTGSSTGSIVQLPGNRLMVVGHYRPGSKPYENGIWRSISEDDGRTWQEPKMVTNLKGVEPVLVRAGDRLLVFIRGSGAAAGRQHIAVSDDFGETWSTELSDLAMRNQHATLITHPFAMVNPANPNELLAATIERPLPSSVELWRVDPKTLAFKHDRKLLTIPKIDGDPNDDFGYPWLLPKKDGGWLLFYYHGKKRGESPIWVTEFKL